jgi:hypothetical protein
LDSAGVIALGYLERLRTGIGSPFRTIEQALRDPRLDVERRDRLGWALTDQLLRGHTFETDPAVLDGSDGAGPTDRAAVPGRRYLTLIESVVGDARDPREGELAVRIGFALGVAEGLVARGTERIAAEAAALARDRLEARGDAVALLTLARARRQPFFDVLAEARSSRTLRVESPRIAELDVDARQRAVRLARVLHDSLRAVVETPGAPSAARNTGTWLTPRSARDLSRWASWMPPRAAISTVLSGHAPGLRDSGAAPVAALPVATEESFTAHRAMVAPSRTTGIVALRVAVAMRSLAQEPVWFPGDPGPTVAEVTEAFGLRGITFTPNVPRRWHPFYARMLGQSIRDFQRVFPTYSAAGLRVRFEAAPLPGEALALHDPASRTLRLAVQSSAGTLAHELAHDLDWQAAGRVFVRAGGYSTDRAAREHHGTLGQSVRGLTAARVMTAQSATAVRAQRPAEVFARGVDWLVATALAQTGRSNGYLTSIQDAVLTGPTAGSVASLGSTATTALVSAVREMTHLADADAATFQQRWGHPTADLSLAVASMGATTLSRRVVARPAMTLSEPVFPAAACTPFPGDPVGAQLARMVVDARARGVVVRRARWYPGASRPAWAKAALGIAPWSPDARDEMIAFVAAQIARDVGARARATPAPFVSAC